MVTSLPSNVVGIMVLIGVAWFILKLLFSLGGSAVDAAENAGFENQYKSEQAEARLQATKNYLDLITNLYKNESGSVDLNTKINSGAKLDSIKEGFSRLFNIEIYDDTVLIGKSLEELKHLVELQVLRYQEQEAK